MVTYPKTSPKMVNPRDLAGNAEEEKEEKCFTLWFNITVDVGFV